MYKSIYLIIFIFSLVTACSRFDMDKDITPIEEDDITQMGDGSGTNVENYDFSNYNGTIDSKDDVESVFDSEVNKSLFDTTSAIPGAIPGITGAIPATATSDTTAEFFKSHANENPIERLLNRIFKSARFNQKFYSFKYDESDTTDTSDDDEDYEYPFTSEGLPDCVTTLQLTPVSSDLTIITSLFSKESLTSSSVWEATAASLRVDDTAFVAEAKKLFSGFSVDVAFSDSCEIKLPGGDYDTDSSDVDTVTVSGSFTGAWSFTSDSTIPEVTASASLVFTNLTAKGPGGGDASDPENKDCLTIELSANGNFNLSSTLSGENSNALTATAKMSSDTINFDLICCLDETCENENRAELSWDFAGSAYFLVETAKGDESIYYNMTKECDDDGENCTETGEDETPFDDDAKLALSNIYPGNDGSFISDFDINTTLTTIVDNETNTLAIDLALILKLDFIDEGPQTLTIHEGGFGLQFDLATSDEDESEECNTIAFKILHSGGEIPCTEYVSLNEKETYIVECTYSDETFEALTKGSLDKSTCL